MRFAFENPWLLTWLLVMPIILVVLRFTLADSTRAQLALSTVTRLFIVLLIILAIGGAIWAAKSDDVAVLVLADLSDSTPKSAPEQVGRFLDALEERVQNPERAGLLIFGAAVAAAHPVEHRPNFPEALEPPNDRSETSIEKALLMAREMMPHDAVNRVVIWSDGNETNGDALAAAKRLRAHGISVYTMPYEQDESHEVLLEDLKVPAEVKQGQSFSIAAVAHSEFEGPATFTLFRDGFKIQEKEISLEKGANTIRFEEGNPGDGLTKYELRVTAQEDYFVDNNVASGIVYVAGEPRVLLLEGDEREGRHLMRALGEENIHVDLREGKGLPANLDELAAFDAVIVSDVPATDMSVPQMNLLRSYVEDLGGGLIMVGGEESFGIGGYYRTPVEEALPVKMRAEKKTDTPSLAMMVIIDKSGSMSGEKIELAKEAAISTVELMGDRDYVGVVCFDSQAYWVVEMQGAGNSAGIVQSISTIEAGGGTSIYPALEEGYDALRSVSAVFKHVVLLTDGQSQPGDFAGIVDSMAGEQITVSTVGIGDGADTVLLQDIARWGRGRYYFTSDPYDIPQIFTKETMKASKSSLVEEPFLPQIYQMEQAIQTIDWESAPFLFGYIVTTPKTTGKVSLVTERGDPLLVTWQYGLGKTAAFTSDAKSRWAADWLGWPGYTRFWSQLVRDVMRTSQSRGVETQIAYRGGEATVTVDHVDENGNFRNSLDAQVQLIDPKLGVAAFAMQQTAPGRYETQVPMKDIGSYILKLTQSTEPTGDGESTPVADYTRGFTISYKPEYRHLATNEDFLKSLAEVTQGQYRPSLDDLFAVSEGEQVTVQKKLWPWLLAAAVVLFLMDVALRRLDLAGVRLGGRTERYG